MSDEIYSLVNGAIDLAVTDQQYKLNIYDFAKSEKMKRRDMVSFLNSSLVSQMRDEAKHLDMYLNGGPADLTECYGWMGKTRAAKYRDYLYKMIEDAERYEKERRPGRKPGSKNKKKSGVANK